SIDSALHLRNVRRIPHSRAQVVAPRFPVQISADPLPRLVIAHGAGAAWRGADRPDLSPGTSARSTGLAHPREVDEVQRGKAFGSDTAHRFGVLAIHSRRACRARSGSERGSALRSAGTSATIYARKLRR